MKKKIRNKKNKLLFLRIKENHYRKKERGNEIIMNIGSI